MKLIDSTDKTESGYIRIRNGKVEANFNFEPYDKFEYGDEILTVKDGMKYFNAIVPYLARRTYEGLQFEEGDDREAIKKLVYSGVKIK